MQSRIYASLQSLVITLYPIQCASLHISALLPKRTSTPCAHSVPTQEGILKLAVCPLKYTHTHSVHPLCAHSRGYSGLAVCPLKKAFWNLPCANSSIRTPTLCPLKRAFLTCRVPNLCPLKKAFWNLPCAHSSIRTPTLCAHSRDDTANRVEPSHQTSAIAVIDIGYQPTCFHSHSHC